MSCPVKSEDLSALIDGELDAVSERVLRDHVAVCEKCRLEFDAFADLSVRLSRGYEESGPPVRAGFVERVVARAIGRRRSRRARSLPILVAVAVLLGFVAAGSAWLSVRAGAPAGTNAARRAEPLVARYRARLAKILPGDARAHVALARWCREKGLGELATDEYLCALGIDPHLSAAREGLAEFLPPSFSRKPVAIHVPALPGKEAPLSFSPRLTREERLALLGLSSTGGRRLTSAAARRLREFREAEDLLERISARKRALVAATTSARAEDPVASFLLSLKPGPAVVSAGKGDIAFVPLLRRKGSAEIHVMTAAAGLGAGTLTIAEDRAADTRLTVTNRDPTRYVFFPAGEILVGGQQDRMVDRDVLLPPKTSARLPVLCAEHDRWAGASDRFVTTAGIAPPGIRRLLLGVTDQEGIWARIGADLRLFDAQGGTSALRHVFTRGKGPALAGAARKQIASLLSDPRVVGFASSSSGELLGVEVFSDHALFRKFAPAFAGGYALAAAGPRDAPRGAPSVAGLLDAASRAVFYRSGGGGSGEATEFGGRAGGVCGHALVPCAGALPLHVSVFPAR